MRLSKRVWMFEGETGIHVVVEVGGKYVCSCIGWERAKNGMCKHVKEVMRSES